MYTLYIYIDKKTIHIKLTGCHILSAKFLFMKEKKQNKKNLFLTDFEAYYLLSFYWNYIIYFIIKVSYIAPYYKIILNFNSFVGNSLLLREKKEKR